MHHQSTSPSCPAACGMEAVSTLSTCFLPSGCAADGQPPGEAQAGLPTRLRFWTLCRSAPPVFPSPLVWQGLGGRKWDLKSPQLKTKWLTSWMVTLRNWHYCIWSELHYSNGWHSLRAKLCSEIFKQAPVCQRHVLNARGKEFKHWKSNSTRKILVIWSRYHSPPQSVNCNTEFLLK